LTIEIPFYREWDAGITSSSMKSSGIFEKGEFLDAVSSRY
jgi:hypothetical protein